MVSIIMPVYNGAKYLPQTLDSIENQTYSNWQLIAVDDCSVDNTIDLLQQFKTRYNDNVKVIQSTKPQSGAAACRNIGLENANSKLVIFLDADDKLEPFCLQQRVTYMQGNPNADWAVFNQYAWNTEVNPPFPLYNQQLSSEREAIMYFVQMNPAWQTMAVIWKRKILIELHGFDESLYFMEDPDLHLRALLIQNKKCAFAFQYPADCYYRLPLLTVENSKRFYDNSIKSRFVFIEKLVQLLRAIDNDMASEIKKNIRIGFFDFLKKMLIARLRHYSQEFIITINLLKNNSILSQTDIIKLKLIYTVFVKDNFLIKALRLKGLAIRLL